MHIYDIAKYTRRTVHHSAVTALDSKFAQRPYDVGKAELAKFNGSCGLLITSGLI